MREADEQRRIGVQQTRAHGYGEVLSVLIEFHQYGGAPTMVEMTRELTGRV